MNQDQVVVNEFWQCAFGFHDQLAVEVGVFGFEDRSRSFFLLGDFHEVPSGSLVCCLCNVCETLAYTFGSGGGLSWVVGCCRSCFFGWVLVVVVIIIGW